MFTGQKALRIMTLAPLTIWLLTDGKPGHRNQLRGLLMALEKQLSVTAHWIEISHWYQTVTGPVPKGKPDLILCCGHRTHIPALLTKLCYGGDLTVLMKPSLPLWLFDLCVIPEHDQPPTRKNIITTCGVLNTIEASHQQEVNRGLILIGGPSKHHLWDNHAAIDQIQTICQQEQNIQWTLTTSRRTPAEFDKGLLEKNSAIPNLTFIPVADTGTNWVQQHMQSAGTIWVSEDSVSMVYESLTSGAKVGLIEVPRAKQTSRIYNSIDSLNLNNIAPFDNQAVIAASEIKKRFSQVNS